MTVRKNAFQNSYKPIDTLADPILYAAPECVGTKLERSVDGTLRFVPPPPANRTFVR